MRRKQAGALGLKPVLYLQARHPFKLAHIARYQNKPMGQGHARNHGVHRADGCSLGFELGAHLSRMAGGFWSKGSSSKRA